MENAFSIATVVLVVFVIAVISVGLLAGTAGILEELSSTDTARGLITFIFAFGVMSLAFILILSLFFSHAQDVVARFDKAKEVFTSLIVILGTIMGFYFGVEVATQATEDAGESVQEALDAAQALSAEPEEATPVEPAVPADELAEPEEATPVEPAEPAEELAEPEPGVEPVESEPGVEPIEPEPMDPTPNP